MAGQFFTEQKSYVGFTLRGALLDVFSLASTVSGYGDVMGGENVTIQEADFSKETSLAEGARGLTTPTNFVLMDKQDGTKLAMRRPRPGSAGREVAFYTPDDYRPGEFTVDWTADQPYVKVDVYRRNDDDTGYAVRDVRDVIVEGRSNVRRRRWWFVPDWPGDQASATVEAIQISRELMGMGKFSLAVRLDVEPWRYDAFTAQRIVEEEDGPYLETLDLVSTDSVSADFASEIMTLTGDSLLRSSVPYDDTPGNPPSSATLDSSFPYTVGGA
jgi:hypothetical protein